MLARNSAAAESAPSVPFKKGSDFVKQTHRKRLEVEALAAGAGAARSLYGFCQLNSRRRKKEKKKRKNFKEQLLG